MQNVVVDVPENAMLALLELETVDIADEDLSDWVIEIIGNCLTTINRVRIVLEPHNLNADNYFTARLYASEIDSMNPFKEPRCPLRIFFSQDASSNACKNQTISIKNPENKWIADLVGVFADAVVGKTVYGFSDKSLFSINIARQRIGLGPLES